MDPQSATLVLSVFTIALLHTLIPSHWLCFVLVGRSQGWRLGRTLSVAAAAGSLHVVVTIGLGLALAWLAREFIHDPDVIERVSGIALIGLGSLFLILHVTHFGHHHEADRALAGRLAIVALIMAVTFSPCSLVIPILVTAAQSAHQVLLVALVLLVTTIGNMMLLISLTSLGIEKLQFRFFDRYEKLIVGVVLASFGLIVLFAHRH